MHDCKILLKVSMISMALPLTILPFFQAVTDATLKAQIEAIAAQMVAKETAGVNGFAFLMDRTLRYKSHGPWESGEDSGTSIFQFQKDLAYVIGHVAYGTNDPKTTLTGKPYYLDWFSDKEA